ncbi:MAG: insulinase family protein [Alphaproteobacteria bacterium]|nr:insulinase family protein [Alphaproteobacteria bacterium]
MMRFSLILFACFFSASAHATQVQEVVSPSGIKAWLVEEHTLPLVAVRVAFVDSGFASDPKGKEGLSNLTTGLLMEGAGDMDSKTFNEAIESRAIQMNVSTDEDKVEALMETLSEHKDSAFSYLGMALSKPRFDDSAIERVRTQAISVIASQEEKPGYQAYRAWQKMAFGEHGYASPSLGTKDSLARLSQDDLRHFASRYITRQNMIIAVSGDITAGELSALLEKHFSALPAAFAPDAPLAEVNVAASAAPQHIDFTIPQTIVMFGAQGLKRDDPDYFSAYVMNHLIGGGGALNSRLGTEIREKRGLAYSVSTANNPMAHGAVWRGSFSTRSEKLDEAKTALLTTLKDFVQNGPTEAELADAKQYLTGSFVLSLDSNAGITGFLIAMQENNLGRDYLNRRNSLVEKVTRADVMAMSRRLINPDNLLMVTVGKKASEKK